MSNFLNRLVDKNFQQQTEMVQPRPLSLFEPTSSAISSSDLTLEERDSSGTPEPYAVDAPLKHPRSADTQSLQPPTTQINTNLSESAPSPLTSEILGSSSATKQQVFSTAKNSQKVESNESSQVERFSPLGLPQNFLQKLKELVKSQVHTNVEQKTSTQSSSPKNVSDVLKTPSQQTVQKPLQVDQFATLEVPQNFLQKLKQSVIKQSVIKQVETNVKQNSTRSSSPKNVSDVLKKPSQQTVQNSTVSDLCPSKIKEIIPPHSGNVMPRAIQRTAIALQAETVLNSGAAVTQPSVQTESVELAETLSKLQESLSTESKPPQGSLLNQITQSGMSNLPKKQQTSPTIQITIGRIEVRANSQPKQSARKSRAKQSVMSLGEYLHRRSIEE